MKLVNLDQKLIISLRDETLGGVVYEIQISLAEAFEKFFKGNAPEIVEAVPVAWLARVRNDADEAGDLEMRDAITGLIFEWRKEQEART